VRFVDFGPAMDFFAEGGRWPTAKRLSETLHSLEFVVAELVLLVCHYGSTQRGVVDAAGSSHTQKAFWYLIMSPSLIPAGTLPSVVSPM